MCINIPQQRVLFLVLVPNRPCNHKMRLINNNEVMKDLPLWSTSLSDESVYSLQQLAAALSELSSIDEIYPLQILKKYFVILCIT